ncbi:MAG TPA: sigma factor-like helix-turn-helix DNA-binding protein, partial [Gammaproteobacteria bacterium]|nr:sigma factor-like helix-turn-helix DNA-binding protein [Gammaproteobacteria bacterium]
ASVISRDELAALARVIADLPHKWRTVLVLAAIEQRSHAECAEILGVSPKAVETRLARARRALRVRLAGDD